MSLRGQLWPLAKVEGLKSRDDLEKLDLLQIQTDSHGKVIVPPMFFSQQRAIHPGMFKRASEMTHGERQEFISGVKDAETARLQRRSQGVTTKYGDVAKTLRERKI